MPNIQDPDPLSRIVDDQGKMDQEFMQWTQDITRLDLIVGTGSPEGVISAVVGQEFMDDAGIAGAIKYIKRDSDIAGDPKQGWILI